MWPSAGVGVGPVGVIMLLEEVWEMEPRPVSTCGQW
jgi:hypothetical protein